MARPAVTGGEEATETSPAPRLSVVVPIYNVERYLAECLESVAAQAFGDFECVMVDDGSTDSSAEIARRWAAGDGRFRLVQQANQGLGGARNTGVRHARGEYLAFLDSDDLVPPDSYRLMIATLERTGSDFAQGNVHRFNSTGRWQAPLVKGVAATRRLGTHVTRDHLLLRDHLAHNKMWRMSFWRDNGITFPAGVLYEDVPTVIPAHYRARAVDVLPEVAVLWREREPGDASITQNRAGDPRQLRDRLAGVSHNSRFFAAEGAWELKAAYDVLALNRDLRFFVDVYEDVDDAYREQMHQWIGQFLDEVPEDTMARLSAVNRIKYALLGAGAHDQLIELLRRVRTDAVKDAPVVISGDRAILDIAPRGDGAVALPDATFDITDELPLVARISEIRVTGAQIELDGWAYIDRLVTGARRDTTIDVWLENGAGRIPARLTRRTDPRAAELAGPPLDDCADAAFTAVIPLPALRGRWRWTPGTWTVHVAVAHGPIRRAAQLDRPLDGKAERPVAVRLRGRWWLRVCWEEAGGLSCRIRQETATLTDARVAAGEIEFELAVPGRLGNQARLEFRPAGPGPVRTVPIRRVRGLGRVGLARLNPDLLPGGGTATPAPDAPASAADPGADDTETTWTVYSRPWAKGRAQRVLVADGCGAAAVPTGGKELCTRRTRSGGLSLLWRPIAPKLRSATWLAGATLRIELDYPGPAAGAPAASAVLLSSRRQSEELAFPVEPVPGGVAGTLELAALNSFGQRLPIRAGIWDVHLRTGGGDIEVAVAGSVVAALPVSTRHAGREYDLTDRRWHRAALVVSTDLAPDERGNANQHRLRTTAYPAAKRGLREVVLYESYSGKQFSDSPRTIFDELARRGVELEHLIVVRDQQAVVPEGGTAVPFRSRRYYEALATARFIVNNTHLPAWFERAPGQVVVQTWHGVGTKRIGLDIQNVQFANVGYLDKLVREVANWDYLISPNPFTSPILRRAFAYEGTLLETGAPRNDLFHAPDRQERAAAIRTRLGVPSDRRIVLYAPTWRDDRFTAAGRYRLDLRVDLAGLASALGDDHVVLFRKHANIVDKLPTGISDSVIDASDYPDVQDLLLVTDVLVSDYSTLMCDFANTGRPMLFYTYDLDVYRDHLRGFYFDFEAEVPGPLIADEADLAPAVLDAEGIRAKHDAAYRAFAERFCPWDDGKAAARVVDAVFGDLAPARPPATRER
jgi:CDP-glycerol glycerophosphotransferase